jgi:acylphosphatase
MDGGKAVLVRITGRVQGVNYRAWAEREARRLGVSGWVRNEADGSVRALVGGGEDAVTAMLERLRTGPPAAAVQDLQTEDAPGEDLPPAFEVRL